MTNIETYTGIDDLIVSLRDGVLTVMLNRPDSLNSLTAPMLDTLADTMERAAADPAVRVVRLGGAGRGFSSGASIGAEDHANPGAHGTPDDTLAAANRAVAAIVALPKPVVSVVQGPAAGVGVSVAIAADIILASEKAYFLLAFTKIGLMPDGGASALVAASIGRTRAMRMALLAERLSAADALAAGLVSAVYADDDLEAGVNAVIDTLQSGPAIALRKTKHAVNAATLTELEGAFERETEGQLSLLSSPDFREGTTAFQQRRPAVFTDD
ncbi:enoyl-CoA hydratase [Mycobacterium antarcticum]|uniref:enoyl-CoA hydratase n=1 Tax=Mycolicibacterium sp. TUM20983 TaxID=3023369 RepID=UPI00238CBA71|nr:enoyl-CoA hydratase [Mycolicibacterium sp. TUM20983]GLP74110.1 enoyl-CoA hydratase [Mycolicibacterium sp. TUM20983]